MNSQEIIIGWGEGGWLKIWQLKNGELGYYWLKIIYIRLYCFQSNWWVVTPLRAMYMNKVIKSQKVR